jgi:hypothetical protein
MTNLKNNNDFFMLTAYNIAPCVQPPLLWVKISFVRGDGGGLSIVRSCTLIRDEAKGFSLHHKPEGCGNRWGRGLKE